MSQFDMSARIMTPKKLTFRNSQGNRASDFFQDRWAEVTHGAKNGGSFSEMIGQSIC